MCTKAIMNNKGPYSGTVTGYNFEPLFQAILRGKLISSQEACAEIGISRTHWLRIRSGSDHGIGSLTLAKFQRWVGENKHHLKNSKDLLLLKAFHEEFGEQ